MMGTSNHVDQIGTIIATSTSEQIAVTAELWQASGDLTSATRLLEAAVNSKVSHPGLWHNLGAVRSVLGDYLGAVDAYTNAIGEGYPSFVSRGLSYEQLQNWDAARHDYLAALEFNSEDVDALVDLGTLELSLGRTAEGAVRLFAAATIDPRANWQLADAYMARGDAAKAKGALLEAIDAGELRAYLDLAKLEIGHAAPVIVESYFMSAIEAEATLARREFVIYLDDEGQTERALTVALEGIEKGDRSCFAPLAVIYESLGQLDLALKYYALTVQDGEDAYQEDLARLRAVTASRKGRRA
jgi:tetratricopeptide (TPR) repeat protein